MQNELTRALRQRGHEVTAQGSERDLLLPNPKDTNVASSFREILYSLMHRDSIRKALRDWAYGNVGTQSNKAAHAVESYKILAQQFGGWKDDSPEAIQKLYANTFEWYVSELLRREFSARASGFGIRLKDADPDDEFDCIALLDSGLVFVECKTGRGGLYEEVEKFIRRDKELDAQYSFFIYDRDYTFQRGPSDIPELAAESAGKLGIQEICSLSITNHEFFRVIAMASENETRYFLACGGFKRLEDRIRYMIRYCKESTGLLGLQEAPRFKATPIPFAVAPISTAADQGQPGD